MDISERMDDQIKATEDQVEVIKEKVTAPIEDQVEAIKEKVTEPLPTPPPLGPKATAKELKKRLDWGEPALTIIDVRDREIYNQEHITGAVPMPMPQLVSVAQDSLAPQRDIYVYGGDDAETAEAANQLRQVGFHKVSALQGNLQGWKAIAGPTDGFDA